MLLRLLSPLEAQHAGAAAQREGGCVRELTRGMATCHQLLSSGLVGGCLRPLRLQSNRECIGRQQVDA